MILRIVVCPEEYWAILERLHIDYSRRHYNQEELVRRVLWEGLWWSALHDMATKFVLNYIGFKLQGGIIVHCFL